MISLVGQAARGVVAAAAGTLAMDLVWYARYRRGGGTQDFPAWETAAGLTSYEKAPAPAQVGRKAYKAVTGDDPPPASARLMTNAVHWATGLQWGAAYALAAPYLRQPWAAMAFAPVVWGSSYVILPALGVYKPIWTYDAKTLWQDFSAHLAYGAVTTGIIALER